MVKQTTIRLKDLGKLLDKCPKLDSDDIEDFTKARSMLNNLPTRTTADPTPPKA